MGLVLNLLQKPRPVQRRSTETLCGICQGLLKQKRIIFANLQRLEDVGTVLLPSLQNVNHGEGRGRLTGEDSIFRGIANSWQPFDYSP